MDIKAHNIEAEKALLAAIMIDPWRLPEVADTLKGEYFYRESHRVVWEAIIKVY